MGPWSWILGTMGDRSCRFWRSARRSICIREDAVSRAKLQEFEQYVEKSGKKTVAGKFHKIHVPMVTG